MRRPAPSSSSRSSHAQCRPSSPFHLARAHTDTSLFLQWPRTRAQLCTRGVRPLVVVPPSPTSRRAHPPRFPRSDLAPTETAGYKVGQQKTLEELARVRPSPPPPRASADEAVQSPIQRADPLPRPSLAARRRGRVARTVEGLARHQLGRCAFDLGCVLRLLPSFPSSLSYTADASFLARNRLGPERRDPLPVAHGAVEATAHRVRPDRPGKGQEPQEQSCVASRSCRGLLVGPCSDSFPVALVCDAAVVIKVRPVPLAPAPPRTSSLTLSTLSRPPAGGRRLQRRAQVQGQPRPRVGPQVPAGRPAHGREPCVARRPLSVPALSVRASETDGSSATRTQWTSSRK